MTDLGFLDSLESSELEQVAQRVADILAERAVLRGAEERMDELAQQVISAKGVTWGDSWVEVISGYPVGWEVAHPLPGSDEVGTWVNIQPGNRYAPGSPGGGWSLLPPDGETPALWVKPAWAELGYDTGDEVTFPTYADGAVYRSLIDQNAWSPSEYPDGWERLGGEEPDPDPGEIPVWVKPVWPGEAGGAYALGDKVHYPDASGPVYVSVHDGWNAWVPDGVGAFGWSLDEGS